MKIIGERLKALRRGAGISQAVLAAAVGAKQPAYARYELGEVMPPFSVFVRLCDYFGVSADYLLGRTANPSGRIFGEAGAMRDARVGEALALCFTEGSEANARLKELLREVMAGV